MGIYDRDYYRATQRSSIGSLPLWSITTWIILINVAVFVLEIATTTKHPATLGFERGVVYVAHSAYADDPFTLRGCFSISQALNHWQLWRFITFQFLHATPMHIFGNMLGLFFFGPMVESYLGRQRYVFFYLSCGVAGALFFTLLTYLHVPGFGPNDNMIGASAGVFGVLIAGASIAPDVRVMLLFPPIPMKLKYLAWGMLGFAAYTVLTSNRHPGNNAGGEAAHLGGAAWGYLLIRFARWLPWPWGRRRQSAKFWQP